jgi:hypothetical protein
MKTCCFCGCELKVDHIVSRQEICPRCHRDVRCCLNCALYDAAAPNQCREPQSEAIRERDRSNFCDFFVCNDTEGGTGDENTLKRVQDEWENLFKN